MGFYVLSRNEKKNKTKDKTDAWKYRWNLVNSIEKQTKSFVRDDAELPEITVGQINWN